MFKRILELLVEPDPVDKWLSRICQSHGLDCTITWGRLFMTLCSLTAAIIVFFFIRFRRQRWEVKCQASLPSLKRSFLGRHGANQYRRA